MTVYKFCSMSNINQTTTNFEIDFSYFVEEIMNTKIWESIAKKIPVTGII